MRKNLKRYSFLIFTVFWIIFAIHLQIVFSVHEAIADENTAVIIRSHQVSAYDEAVNGFEKGCKERNISMWKNLKVNSISGLDTLVLPITRFDPPWIALISIDNSITYSK